MKVSSHVRFLLITPLFLTAWLLSTSLFAQVTDSTFQKPQLNQGTMPPAENMPVIVTPPSQIEKQKVKVKVKTEPVPETQDEEKPSWKHHFFTGGSGTFAFGTYTFIQVAPILGYQLTDRFAVGTGLSYIFAHNPDGNFHIFGGKVFADAMVYNNFFAHGEFELLDFGNNLPAVLVGAGYRQFMSNRAALDLMLLFDINQNARSYYTNPIFRTGFIIYL